jgi:mannose-6-phosphate isomerase-like protein (cupin superfamily)
MNAESQQRVQAAQVVLPCAEVDPTLEFFTDRLGFRVAAIYPADDPRTVVVSGYGLRLQLQKNGHGDPGSIRLLCDDPTAIGDGATELTAPNGTRIELVDADPPVVVPPVQPELVVTKVADAKWGVGRAGMRYRDLIPGRLGGSFIASHIQIPTGGPVPDYVHFHKIRFQMIYNYKGWVRLVYEDQGPEFVMKAGDCVLQPPTIRHRVLECSDGFEVVEIGCPAEHETFGDLEMTLPTGVTNPSREFGGQRFCRHDADKATWHRFRIDGFEHRDIGIADATDGLATVRVARVSGSPSGSRIHHDAEFLFWFVLEGSLTLKADGREPEHLGARDSVVLPAGLSYALADCSPELEFLEVALPAAFETSKP